MTYITNALSLFAFLATWHSIVDEPFRITAKRPDDRIEVTSDGAHAIFAIRSPSGISNTTIERTTESWPQKIVLQLRLRGLESFKLSTDKQKLEASVSSQNCAARLWKVGEEATPLDPKSPYWMDLRMLDSEGKPARSIPLENGYIEIQLPTKLFEDNPKSIKVEWIDFYRN
ncbi:MAG: hypothetical protein SFV81_26450 [Pirellulaceae bacterium]|nr:hypothetical protein [Pirellulaceae bacterium]